MPAGWELFEQVREVLGDKETLESLAKALGDDELFEDMIYIARMWDIGLDDEEKEENE